MIGFEGVGIVEGVGEGVTNFKTGDKVAYGIPPLGSYAETRNYPADKLLHMPDGLEDEGYGGCASYERNDSTLFVTSDICSATW